MRLSSKDFKHLNILDKKFTCDGEDISPHLKWNDVPKETKSFALSCINPESNYGIVSHWLVINIPKDINEIVQGIIAGGEEIENDFGTTYYRGPCEADRLHKYHFKVYALNIEKLANINCLNFRKNIQKNCIDYAEIIGLYQSEIKLNIKSCGN